LAGRPVVRSCLVGFDVRMRGTRAAAVAVAVVACLLTVGCTPAPLGMAGVYLNGGQPTVLIRPCPGVVVSQVWVYQRAANLRWGAVVGDHSAVTEVLLLQAPAGWTASDVPAANQLTEFQAGTSYQVQVATERPKNGDIDLVEFTLGDLHADTVWATRPHGQPQVLTRAEFAKQAADVC
jgi:hypothetical protein